MGTRFNALHAFTGGALFGDHRTVFVINVVDE
jgi:hypothetical protein